LSSISLGLSTLIVALRSFQFCPPAKPVVGPFTELNLKRFIGVSGTLGHMPFPGAPLTAADPTKRLATVAAMKSGRPAIAC
jgi:hypothetical protein